MWKRKACWRHRILPRPLSLQWWKGSHTAQVLGMMFTKTRRLSAAGRQTSQDTFLKECSDKVWNSLCAPCWPLPFLKWTSLSSRVERIGLMGKDRNSLRNFHLGAWSKRGMAMRRFRTRLLYLEPWEWLEAPGCLWESLQQRSFKLAAWTLLWALPWVTYNSRIICSAYGKASTIREMEN